MAERKSLALVNLEEERRQPAMSYKPKSVAIFSISLRVASTFAAGTNASILLIPCDASSAL